MAKGLGYHQRGNEQILEGKKGMRRVILVLQNPVTLALQKSGFHGCRKGSRLGTIRTTKILCFLLVRSLNLGSFRIFHMPWNY